jgi:hypothetical protein
VLAYGGANAVYRLSEDYLRRYQVEHHMKNQGPEFFVPFAPNEKIDAQDLIPVTDTSSDPKVCASIASFLTSHRHAYEVRYGTDITTGDLANMPAIFIGAFNNSWTLNITRPLRFVFKEGVRIEDTWGKTPGWQIRWTPNGDLQDDYAVVTRLLDPKTGRMFVSVAGIGSSGTIAATNFITNPREISAFNKIAPAGWQNMNMQIVLHVRVLNQALDNDDIVVTQFW